jgi:hypothetical protein
MLRNPQLIPDEGAFLDMSGTAAYGTPFQHGQGYSNQLGQLRGMPTAPNLPLQTFMSTEGPPVLVHIPNSFHQPQLSRPPAVDASDYGILTDSGYVTAPVQSHGRGSTYGTEDGSQTLPHACDEPGCNKRFKIGSDLRSVACGSPFHRDPG